MSRLYHNEPLSALPVKNHRVDFTWDPKQYSGHGVVLEGCVANRSRHAVTDKGQCKHRYYALHVKVTKAFRRMFSSIGVEIEPNLSETEKVRQGYLNSSYKTVAKGVSDQLSQAQVRSTLQCPLVDKLCGAGSPDPYSVILWAQESQLDMVEINTGDNIRCKTVNDSPFLESVARLDAQSSTVSNYAGGENVGGSWTDKVMAAKADTPQTLPQDLVEGVDDDEWDD